MSSSVARVYTLVYSADPETGRRRHLLGIEAVVHGRARREMIDTLMRPTCRSQRVRLKQLIADGRAVLQPRTGRIASQGPWRGGNFGGTLLVGRAALAGGRIAHGENAAGAAVRELVEELRLPREILADKTLFTKMQLALSHVCDSPTPGRLGIERFYSLDLDAVRGTSRRLGELLSAGKIVRRFDPGADAPDDADAAEKRAVRIVDEDELVRCLEDGPTDEDVAVIRAEVAELARELCEVLGISLVPESLVQCLVDYQTARRIPTHADAARMFVHK